MLRFAGKDPLGGGRRLAVATLALGLSCCGGRLFATGMVETPARVPVRVFPRIVVAAADALDSPAAADALARHLAGDGSRVRRASLEDLRASRAEGAIAPATVVLRVELTVSVHPAVRWRPPPGATCGFAGCVDDPPQAQSRVEEVRGRLELRVVDGPSGRTLQREVLEDQEVGDDTLGGRLRIARRLIAQAQELVDQNAVAVRVRLLPAGPPRALAALELIAAGDWSGGRRALEQVASGEGFARLPAVTRARLLYDLGQARRFDDALPPDQRFELAEQALTRAVRLAAEPVIAAALDELAAEALAHRTIRAQTEARSHNFAVGGDGPRVPPPPAGYSD